MRKQEDGSKLQNLERESNKLPDAKILILNKKNSNPTESWSYWVLALGTQWEKIHNPSGRKIKLQKSQNGRIITGNMQGNREKYIQGLRRQNSRSCSIGSVYDGLAVTATCDGSEQADNHLSHGAARWKVMMIIVSLMHQNDTLARPSEGHAFKLCFLY